MDLTKPCFHVFAAPELARPICMHLRKPDKASLLRTCRLFFSELRQYLWESANEIIPLVSMIPGGEMIESEVDDIFFPMSYHSTMQLPTVLDLSRLSLYSPYIKSLTMDTQGLSIADEYENWDEFLACAESTPLLPNLEHIQISPSSTICDGHISVECANWIRVFWSPALISFKFTRLNRHFPIFGAPTHVWIGLQDASSFLQSISQRSPRLETLEIFPADVSIRTNSSRGGFAYQSVSGVEYGVISLETSMALSQLRSLRVLVTNSFFLNADAFLALSQLPLLESLSIDGKYGGWQTFASDVRLPDGSFPSLRTLTLKDAIWTSICDLIDQKPLWDSLCTLSIQGYARYDGPETEWDAYMWSKCISRLAKYRSPITSLVFSGAHRQIVDLQMVESLKRLPLVTLSLPSIDTSYPGWDMLFEGIPGIENLTIEPFISDFVPSQLRSIIMMLPRLRELSLPTDRDFMAHLNNETFPSRPRSLVELHLKTNFQLAVNPWHDDEVAANARIVAKFLYSIRPNATYSPGWYYPAFYQGVYWENPLNTSVINETLSRLREESASDPLEISL